MLTSRKSLTIVVLVAVVLVVAGTEFFGRQVSRQHEQTQERVGQLEVELAESVRVQKSVREAKERAQRRADLANEKLQHERTRADTAEAKVQDLLESPGLRISTNGTAREGGHPPAEPAEPVFDTEKYLRDELDKAREEIARLQLSEQQAKKETALAKKAEQEARREVKMALAGKTDAFPEPPEVQPEDRPIPPRKIRRRPGRVNREWIRELQLNRQRALERLQELPLTLPGHNLPIPTPIPGLR